jgi:hypothetical protein
MNFLVDEFWVEIRFPTGLSLGSDAMCLAAALSCGGMVLPPAAEKRSMGTCSISLDGDTGVAELANPGGGVHLHHQGRPPTPSYSSSAVVCVPMVMWQHSTIFCVFHKIPLPSRRHMPTLVVREPWERHACRVTEKVSTFPWLVQILLQDPIPHLLQLY